MITRMVSRMIGAALVLAALAACADDNLSGPLATQSNESSGRPVTVMTQNLYVGADIDPLLMVPPEQLPLVVAQKWQEIQSTNFPERAQAIAAQVAANNPDLIGLQEADVFRIQAPSDFVTGHYTPNAETVVLDFVDVLLQALAARGLNYRVAAKLQGLDVEFPMVTSPAPTFADLRYTEYDVILARSDVPTGQKWQKTYQVNVPLVIGGVTLDWKRGFVAVEAVIAKDTIVFASTHQEVQMFAPVGELQTGELISWANTLEHPLIAVGDFNSAANASAPADRKTNAYPMFLAAGFEDVWHQMHPDLEGLTCCEDALLRNATPAFDQRLDLVLFRQPSGEIVNGAQISIVGAGAADKTVSGLWPSDHAGVVATLHIPRKAGQ